MKTHFLLKWGVVTAGMLVAAQTRVQGQANFHPVTLTPESYTYAIVVPADSPQAVPYCVDAFTGSGECLSCDNTFYEQGLYSRPGETGSNSGIPVHNTVFASINDTNLFFLMPADYTTNDDLMIVNNSGQGYGTITSGTLTFSNATVAKKLALLCVDGNGDMTVFYTLTYSNLSTASGSIVLQDWFDGHSNVVWGANGRMDQGGDYNNYNSSGMNNNVPYLYADFISDPGTNPIVSITFNYDTGASVANIFAVSGTTDGTNYTPIPVSGFNERAIIPADIPFPITATMDNGTNLNPATGLGNTWFEQGFYQANTSYGLPPSGSQFSSYSQPTHTYQMGDYSTNNAVLLDRNHLTATIVPSMPASATGYAFLTAGGDVGTGRKMVNNCTLQHEDGVNETMEFYGYDWFEQTVPGAIAWEANGRVYMNNRTLNTLGNQGLPFLFETYFPLSDTTSPVTNIILQVVSTPSASSTTFVMAVSATTDAIAPLITQNPLPATQTWFPTQTATFTAAAAGSPPLTNIWLVESNGEYVPLTNGIDANGSVVSGADTTTLTISDLTAADGTNYEYVATNAIGGAVSLPATVVINNNTPVAPVIDSQIPDPSISTLTVFTNVPNKTNFFSVTIDTASASDAPPFYYQWYSGVPQTSSNAIADATNATYSSVDVAGVTISCIITNFVGSVTSSPVALVATAPTAYQSAILSHNPVGYWPLDEAEGTIAFDYVGNNNGTFKGSCALGEPGIPAADGVGTSNSVGFDGSSAYVDIPEGDLNIIGPVTVIEWVQTTGEGGLTSSLGHGDSSYRLDVDGNGYPHFADAGPDLVGTLKVTDGLWHQLVGVYDGTNENLYMDGLPAAPPIKSGSAPSLNGYDLFIAGAPDYSPGSRLFAGNLAQVAILTNALDAGEVAALYTAPPYIVDGGSNSLISGTAFVGAPVTYTVAAGGSLPLFYQWFTNGVAVSGATNSSFSLSAGCGDTTIQVAVTNTLSAGTPTLSSLATLDGEAYPTNVTFETDGTGWQLNTAGFGSVPSISGGVLQLTDGSASEASSAFYNVAQYVGSFSASFTYTAAGSAQADGVAFILQDSSSESNALGAAGGNLGYGGITPSVAFEINIYSGAAGGIGIAAGTNGSIGPNGPTGSVHVNSGDPIDCQLNYADGNLAVRLTDSASHATFATNYAFGALSDILGGNLAYVGFSGGDGGDTSIQTIRNFSFASVIPPMTLSVTSLTTNSFDVSWPLGDPNWVLEQSPDLLSWSPGPTPVVVDGFNEVPVAIPSSGQLFYRLVRMVCQ